MILILVVKVRCFIFSFAVLIFFVLIGESDACSQYKSYFFGNDLAVGNELILMTLSCVIYVLLLLFLESIYLQRFLEKVCTFYYTFRNCQGYNFDFGDGDPESGRYTILGLSLYILFVYIFIVFVFIGDKPLMEAKNLQKIYGRNRAVKNVSFAVKPGECFCLLGVNGAGKSTTFRMLTGREAATKGTVEVHTRSGESLTLDKNASEVMSTYICRYYICISMNMNLFIPILHLYTKCFPN